MNKTILLAILVILTGCAALSQAKTDFQACWQDAICREEALAKASETKTKINEVAGVISPMPWVPAVSASVGGGIALIAFLIAGGRKKREGNV